MYLCFYFFFVKQKTAYEMRISDWSADVCSSDLMELHEIMRAAGAGAQVVNALQLGMLARDPEETLTLFLGPFLVHQLIDSVARRTPCAPGKPGCNAKPEHRIDAAQSQPLIQNQRGDYRKIEIQV